MLDKQAQYPEFLFHGMRDNLFSKESLKDNKVLDTFTIFTEDPSVAQTVVQGNGVLFQYKPYPPKDDAESIFGIADIGWISPFPDKKEWLLTRGYVLKPIDVKEHHLPNDKTLQIIYMALGDGVLGTNKISMGLLKQRMETFKTAKVNCSRIDRFGSIPSDWNSFRTQLQVRPGDFDKSWDTIYNDTQTMEIRKKQNRMRPNYVTDKRELAEELQRNGHGKLVTKHHNRAEELLQSQRNQQLPMPLVYDEMLAVRVYTGDNPAYKDLRVSERRGDYEKWDNFWRLLN